MRLSSVLEWLGFTQAAHSGHQPGHRHSHEHDGDHGHTHGVIDPSIATTEKGIWAIKWSFILLAITAVFQILIVLLSGSVALLADTIHNFADATTAIPLWIAFRLAQRKPTETFTYGYGKVEDLAGIAIVGIILFSAIVAGYEAIDRIIHPHAITALGWVAVAGLIGFIGNEVVAVFRIRVGREMNSAALIADGYHARTDGLTSLAVVIGALGVWLGYPLADPIVGLLITAAIFMIVWQSAISVLRRMLDGVEPGIVKEVMHAAEHVGGITKILDVKARWLGHKLHADVAVLTDQNASLAEADKIANALKAELFAHIPTLSVANVRVHGSTPEESVSTDHRHHHAPAPVPFSRSIASGLIEIVDSPAGERMHIVLDREVEGLQATVVIHRKSGEEILSFRPDGPRSRTYASNEVPREPHSFSATLKLTVKGRGENVPFSMEEPHGHVH